MTKSMTRGVIEPIIYGIAVLFWWVCSLTILLPFTLLLKYSTDFQRKWFAWVFTIAAPMFASLIIPMRKASFQMLKEYLSERKKTDQLKILEIGAGGGANFKYYPENSSLIAVDINPNFELSLREKLKQYPEVKFEKLVHSMAEDMSEVLDDTVDVVISTHVLCSVIDPQRVLSEIYRVLKPGGLFVFLEHVAYTDYPMARSVQDIAKPLCTLFFAGCTPNRDTKVSMERVGFTEIGCRYLEPGNIPLFFRPHVIGVARK